MSSVKLLFEIGHSAERKAKPSKHGFTHDWELFVKSPSESNDISQFVEKVVFNLHDSFPKPKRTIKEPPFVVKESGYAGFELTIDIYLRNRDDPKKLTFPYDLDLQPFKSEIKEYFVNNPSDDFKRKCMKGGCQILGNSGDYKNKDYKTSSNPNPVPEIKKPKRPEDSKTKSYFTELFGDPIEKTSTKVVTNKKEEKLPPPQPSSSSHKDKEKSKHKHSPIVDNKESSKKSGDRSAQSSEKPKKDKTRDRDRSEKKDKSAKRALSPNLSSSRGNAPSSSQPAPTKLPPEYQKPSQPKLPALAVEPPIPQQSTSSSTKKSSKKKSYDKDREKKESKKNLDSPPVKKSNKEDSTNKFDSREKNFKPKAVAPELKPPPEVKKHEVVEAERKHKHKKKEKSKEKEKKEKQSKSQPPPAPPVVVAPPPTKSSNKFEKTHLSDESSDGEIDSSPTKPDPEPVIDYKAPIEPERHHTKGSRDKLSKSNEKEDKKRKRAAEKEERDSSVSPPPTKSKKESSPLPTSNLSSKSTNNKENSNDLKVTNEYLDELKDLKHKITTLKNNDHLQHVVRLIAATGCYEITKSTFDFDLVQLDKNTVQRLQEFFAN